MPDIDPKARREVNSALINSGSTAVSRMMDAATSSQRKCIENQAERARIEAEDKAKEDAAKRDASS